MRLSIFVTSFFAAHFLLAQESGAKRLGYQIGYFLGSNLVPILLLVIAALIIYIIILKRKVKT